MLEIYNTNTSTNITSKTEKYQKGNWINLVAPTETEIIEVCKNVNIQEDFIRYALDPEEKARIDIEEDDNTILFIIDVPVREKEGDSLIYSTMPIGIIFVWAAVARKVAEDIGMELFDDTTYEPSRLMYWPSTSADGEFVFRRCTGSKNSWMP